MITEMKIIAVHPMQQEMSHSFTRSLLYQTYLNASGSLWDL